MLRELESVTGSEASSASDRMPGVVSEVLETMFFTEAEPAACDHTWLQSASPVRVRFEGSHSGELLLALSDEAADPLAAGFLGLEPMELTGTQRAQVLEELANIMCGALLSHLWPESRLALASPELAAWQEWPAENTRTGQSSAGDGFAQGAFGDALHRCFLLPEGMLAVSVRWMRASADNEPD